MPVPQQVPVWYAGSLPGARMDSLVKLGKVGDFGIRESESKPGSFTFVVNTKAKPLSFKMRFAKGLHYIGDSPFGAALMDELLAHHKKNGLVGAGGKKLAVTRPSPFLHQPFVGRQMFNVTANGSRLKGSVVSESAGADKLPLWGFRADGQGRAVFVSGAELVPDVYVPPVLSAGARSGATLPKARQGAVAAQQRRPSLPSARGAAPPALPARNAPSGNAPIALDAAEVYLDEAPVVAQDVINYEDMSGANTPAVVAQAADLIYEDEELNDPGAPALPPPRAGGGAGAGAGDDAPALPPPRRGSDAPALPPARRG